MTTHIRLTRPELKRQRESLKRFLRYLPMLKLRQQQLQAQLLIAQRELDNAQNAENAAQPNANLARSILARTPGVNFLETLITPSAVRTHNDDIAGIAVPALDEIIFPEPQYGLISTPAWTDFVLRDLRRLAELRTIRLLLAERCQRIQAELLKTIQRVNLFEQVKIPAAQESIRRIKIYLSDELAAGIGRAKMAKNLYKN